MAAIGWQDWEYLPDGIWVEDRGYFRGCTQPLGKDRYCKHIAVWQRDRAAYCMQHMNIRYPLA